MAEAPPIGLRLSYTLKVDGAAVSDDDVLIVSIRVRRSIGASSHTEIRIDVGGGDVPSDRFAVGRAVEVAVGWDDELRTVFVGDITGLAVSGGYGNKLLVVDAYDRSYRLGIHAESHVFPDGTAADALSWIAEQVGLQADIDATLQATTLEYLPVVGTFSQFVAETAARAGCEWFVDVDKLVVRKRSTAAAPVKLTLGEDLVSFNVRYAASTQHAGVTVRGWDPHSQRQIDGQAGSATPSNDATVMGRNKNTIGAGAAVIWPRLPVDQSEATAMADAAVTRMNESALTGRGETLLVDRLEPGSRLEIDGVDPAWNGEYYVTEVEHIIDSGGGVTRFTVGGLEPASLVDLLGRADQPSADTLYSGLTIGKVTDIADPEKLARVKVKLPYLDDDHQTGFARVMQLGAGGERGLQFLPENDDEVLVAFEHGDRRRPIVLGGLWSRNAEPPPDVVVDGQVERRALTSRLGHELLLRDGSGAAEQLVSITTAGENAVLVMSEEETTLTTKDKKITITNGESTITLDGGDVTIEATNITLKATGGDVKMEGNNVEAKGQMGAKVEGAEVAVKASAKASVDGGGMTEIKGGMVKIN